MNTKDPSLSCSAAMFRNGDLSVPALIFWHQDPSRLMLITEEFMKRGAQLMSHSEAFHVEPSDRNIAYVNKDSVEMHLFHDEGVMVIGSDINTAGKEWLSACYETGRLTVLLCVGDFESVKLTFLENFYDVLGLSVNVRIR